MTIKIGNDDHRQHLRKKIEGEVEFFIDADIVSAKPVDISDGGLCITTKGPVRATLRITEECGKIAEYQAKVVWVKSETGENMSFGLKFIDKDDRGIDFVSF